MTLSTIRTATTSDLQDVLALYRHLNSDDPVPHPPAAELAWTAMLTAQLVTVYVAELADGTLAASCTLVIVPNLTRGLRSYALIENVVTHIGYRRLGLGRAVLRVAMDTAWEAGCYKIMLATGSRREETLRFYESAGFERGGKTFFQARRP
jgi:GNAT superfamily N-acetyltransferase